ncbi:hypothetical protein L208DRAFT_1396271 [Tricholoma matsutake]|nr:hypothetical protein L208DRAFT_1396271 [Tricholoma matsutake 945]
MAGAANQASSMDRMDLEPLLRDGDIKLLDELQEIARRSEMEIAGDRDEAQGLTDGASGKADKGDDDDDDHLDNSSVADSNEDCSSDSEDDRESEDGSDTGYGAL